MSSWAGQSLWNMTRIMDIYIFRDWLSSRHWAKIFLQHPCLHLYYNVTAVVPHSESGKMTLWVGCCPPVCLRNDKCLLLPNIVRTTQIQKLIIQDMCLLHSQTVWLKSAHVLLGHSHQWTLHLFQSNVTGGQHHPMQHSELSPTSE